ncbi:MAG TPA: response regulator transcription factor [Spirochaetales bacterium]|nr:response regulator transcription factor [Spirochaetales bacterium]HRY53679.1 response regulator transcription factor [Spirochaetia bacterium]HRZ64263.1 response regulator transcription factor [Spirochaetia bacterium]
MEVLLAEDEANLRGTLAWAFRRESWSVRDFEDGLAAWEYLQKAPPSAEGRVLVLDIVMPRMDGLELCRLVREAGLELPLLFLSSRDEEMDRVLGLESGADDYLCKPFSVRELLARIRILHARASGRAPGRPAQVPRPESAEALRAGSLVLDTEGFRAWWKGRELGLTVSELRILACLASAPGAVRTRERLQKAAYPEDNYVNERSVDCHIKRIRRKLSALDPGFEGLETVYGAGYRLCPEALPAGSRP